MSLFGPKGLRAEVTEGIDLEQGITLTGDRITIGTGPADDLRLGARDIVPAHLTLQKRLDGKGWEYFTSDRGATLLDKGNPRTGPVRPGMWFRLGAETRIDLQRVPAAVEEASESGEKTTVPMPIAIGIMGVICLVALAGVAGFGSSKQSGGLRTAGWYAGTMEMEPALAVCLAQEIPVPITLAATDPDAAFWTAKLATDPAGDTATETHRQLTRAIRDNLAEAHLLFQEDKYLEASRALRRLEYVLPLGRAECPILEASRVDVALLELLANQ